VSVGWHPWFRRQLATGGPIELDIDLSHARMYVRDADYIPTGRTLPAPPGPWDDCFTDVGAVALHWPGALRLTAEHDCSSLVVYDPDDAVCVEPQSAPPDAINWDPHSVRLEPGGHLEHHVIWRWVKD
jgi:galactose mutarotase-like enzyme